MSTVLGPIGHALGFAFAMFWEILWALILGFALSAVVQAVVSKREMARLLPDDSPKSLAIATLVGAASSSCSYAAVALARSIFRKGANFTAAIAGALMAWVPTSFWQSFFLVNHPVAAYFWGPIVGPIVAMLSFVCSIGNVPLAAVLWNGGISFGGVISFVFADLIVLPILNIYRKYYGVRMMLFLLATSYAAMVAAGLIVELAFMGVGLVPRERAAVVVEPHVAFNYTTVLNIVFLALAAILLVRFFRTNGLAMLRMMNRPPAGGEHAGHGEHGHGVHANEGSSMAADPVCGMQVKTDRATATDRDEHAAA